MYAPFGFCVWREVVKLLEINCERKCGSGDEWPMERRFVRSRWGGGAASYVGGGIVGLGGGGGAG